MPYRYRIITALAGSKLAAIGNILHQDRHCRPEAQLDDRGFPSWFPAPGEITTEKILLHVRCHAAVPGFRHRLNPTALLTRHARLADAVGAFMHIASSRDHVWPDCPVTGLRQHFI
jgi:hypothetical protein